MCRTCHLRRCDVRALWIVLSLFPSVAAQSQQQNPSIAAANSAVIEEIIVTAQRRDKSIQDVPISMTVFDHEDIEALKLINIAEVARYTPNVEWDRSFLGAANFSAIFVRGVGQPGGFFESTADPAVGVYLDGVYIGRALGSVLDVHDVAQVEVLRGPQGTLFGRNTTGGAVTIATTKPADEFTGWGDVTLGSDSRLDARLVLNVPISDQLLARLSGLSLNQDGYGSSLQDGTEYGDIDSDATRAALRWLPGDDITVDLTLDRSRSRQGPPVNTLVFAEVPPTSLTSLYNFFVAPGNSVAGFGDGIPWDARFLTPGNFTNYATGASRSEIDTRGLAATVLWRPGDLTFTSITSFRELESAWGLDVDLSPLTILEDEVFTDQDQFSQEFTLRGIVGPLDWLVGLYYFEEEASGSTNVLIVPEVADVEFDPDFGVPNPVFGVPFSDIGPFPSGRAESIAVFSHVVYEFSNRLSGIAGLRYTSENKKAIDDGSGIILSGQTDDTFTDLSPTIGIQYFIDPGLHLYASASQGFKSGGFNTIVALPRDEFLPFEQEEITAYELGFKMSRERFSLAAATFFNDYEEIQVPVIDNVVPQIRNAAEAEIYGAELELVAALTNELTFQAGIGYLDAEYKQLNEASLQDLIVPITLDSKFPNAPKWSVNLSFDWSSDLGTLGRLRLRGDYSWRDETFKDAINTPELLQGAYGLLFAAASLDTNDGRWQFTLFGDNLTDESYLLAGGANKPDFGLVVATFARPRTWGLNARYNFGQISN
ncbi:MAG: TonB-dependent receptor [Woeseia sp.]